MLLLRRFEVKHKLARSAALWSACILMIKGKQQVQVDNGLNVNDVLSISQHTNASMEPRANAR